MSSNPIKSFQNQLKCHKLTDLSMSCQDERLYLQQVDLFKVVFQDKSWIKNLFLKNNELLMEYEKCLFAILSGMEP